MTNKPTGHPAVLFVLSEGRQGAEKIRYYRSVSEVAKGLSSGHGFSLRGAATFGRLTVLRFDKPGIELTDLVRPLAQSLLDFEATLTPINPVALALGRASRAPEELNAYSDFRKNLRQELSAVIRKAIS